jgi:hypothetical protein
LYQDVLDVLQEQDKANPSVEAQATRNA